MPPSAQAGAQHADHVSNLLANFNSDGFAIIPPDSRIIPPLDLNALRAECDRLLAEDNAACRDAERHDRRPRPRAGARGILDRSPLIRDLARSRWLLDLVESIAEPGAFVARSIVFDKSPDANWDVPWHQDTTIAVREPRDVPGFGPWSSKPSFKPASSTCATGSPTSAPSSSSFSSSSSSRATGGLSTSATSSTSLSDLLLVHIPHVQPPADILRGMVTVRLHLDDCNADNGALRVVPGSHHDLIAPRDIDPAMCNQKAVTCEVPAGGILLMRPLVLHASHKAEHAHHRRVIHLEFTARPLPHGLEWAEH